MTKIEIIELGDLYPFEIDKLKKFSESSKIFRIEKYSKNLNHEILQNSQLILTNKQFENFPVNDTGVDFSVVLVNRPLQGNYFTQPINNKLIVISIFGLEQLNIHEGISLEMYVIRFLLSFSTIFQSYNELPPKADDLMQSNTTGCLFDHCKIKPQIARFFREPHLSPDVISVLNKKTLPQNYISNLQKEIKKLKISNYYLIKDWLKGNPIMAFLITILGTITLGILSSYIYNLLNQ